MVQILSPSGAELPEGSEQHSRAMVNRNTTRLNDLWTEFDAFAEFERMLLFKNAGFAWNAGVSWDAGVLSIDADATSVAQMSTPQPTFATAGTTSGSIKFTEVGFYHMLWVNSPGAAPGISQYIIGASGTWPGTPGLSQGIFGKSDHNGYAYDNRSVVQALIRVPQANLEVRCVGQQTNATTNTARVRILQLGKFV